MDYTKFSIEDFASDASFIDWVNKTDPEADEFWRAFIITHPEMQQKIESARALVINLKRAEKLHHDSKLIESMWQNIDRKISETPIHHLPQRKNLFLKYTIAASVALLISISTWYSWSSFEPHDLDLYNDQLATSEYIESVNKTESPLAIHLADGSIVNLGIKSRLKYKLNYEMDSSRDVYLLGEAFFEVTKNPYKPFIVHSNEVVTEVLGTSFRVKANENEKRVVVSVKTGKVSVYALSETTSSANERNGVILLPNQEVSYERQEQSFDKKLVAAPEVILPVAEKNIFVFDNAPIEKVFKTLEEAYGIEIIYNDEIMKNCFLTAPLGSEPLFEKLKIICQTIGASYEIIDTKVVISASGC